MGAPKKVVQIVDRFRRNLDAYRSGKYNEAQVRQEFINPFFIALGWDVNNEKGYAEAYKDVIHEDAIKIGGATKAPDYCFRIGGTRKFFLEAKKPSVSIKDAPHPAYQLRRYAWSAKLPLSILTDFEEFAVYDCRVKPVSADKASTARTLYIEYEEYADRWGEIASIFSHEEVLKGSFDRYVESTRRKKGTAEVDTAFLKEIESWRDTLARNIALRNPRLTQRELNFAVQRTIDRIIFLRICEDRGVETYGRLMSLLNDGQTYKRLCHLFHQADDRYNSGLFHFRKEKDRAGPPDELTLSLKIDDKLLKDMIRRLYYPESPYEFSVLPADILGQVYEQFLGKVIRLTAGHRAKVEDKPEVKKAGGVYYTPTYIVDYIVKNTVGRLIWGYPADADGTCLACKGKGLGARDWGLGAGESGEQYGQSDQKLQGSSSLARGHGASGAYVQVDAKTARKREVWPETADASSSGIGACQYCGRPWIPPSEGVSEPSQHGQGFPDGAGDLCAPDDETPIREIGPRSGNSGADSNSREVAQRSHPVPEGEALIPSRKPLTPRRAARLRILDPACGSGSFLIGAYQYLLDWHRDYYTNDDPEKWARKRPPRVFQGSGGDWRLTSAERKRILLNNIYGVDIDSQAVEVTKLSLLLKVLEGESTETIGKTLELFHERALPDLANNIKCGNSLIGPDFYDNKQMGLFDDEERYRINAFDWHAEFRDIFKRKNAGFDAVIGNPPYIRIQAMKQWAPVEVEFYKQCYVAASKGNYDIYVVFVEKGLELLNDRGLFGMILPHKFFNAQYGEPLRELVAQGNYLSSVVHFGDKQVFAGSTTYTCLLFLEKADSKEFQVVKVDNLMAWRSSGQAVRGVIPARQITGKEWNLVVGKGADVFARLARMPVKLGDIAHIFVGLQTSADTVFLFKEYERSAAGTVKAYSKQLDVYVELESELLKPVVRSGSIGRFWAIPNALVLFPYAFLREKIQLIGEDEMRRDFPKTWDYLLANRTFLCGREHGKFKDSGWYQLYPKNLDAWDEPKIMLPYMITRLAAFYDARGAYFVNVTTGGFGIRSDEQHGTLRYMTGLLNSKLLDWFIKSVSSRFHGGYFGANKQFLVQVPIRTIDFCAAADIARHDRMVELVDHMLSLHKQLASAKTAHDKTVLQRQIDATDRQIDRLVYELYELTEDEIRIVEKATLR